MNFPKEGECGCWKCSKKWDEENLDPNLGILDRLYKSRTNRFIVCEKCGNKRCPHATDHDYECTGSNEPGQKGSIYE